MGKLEYETGNWSLKLQDESKEGKGGYAGWVREALLKPGDACRVRSQIPWRKAVVAIEMRAVEGKQ